MTSGVALPSIDVGATYVLPEDIVLQLRDVTEDTYTQEEKLFVAASQPHVSLMGRLFDSCCIPFTVDVHVCDACDHK